jgi:hypothetical protein
MHEVGIAESQRAREAARPERQQFAVGIVFVALEVQAGQHDVRALVDREVHDDQVGLAAAGGRAFDAEGGGGVGVALRTVVLGDGVAGVVGSGFGIESTRHAEHVRPDHRAQRVGGLVAVALELGVHIARLHALHRFLGQPGLVEHGAGGGCEQQQPPARAEGLCVVTYRRHLKRQRMQMPPLMSS